MLVGNLLLGLTHAGEKPYTGILIVKTNLTMRISHAGDSPYTETCIWLRQTLHYTETSLWW